MSLDMTVGARDAALDSTEDRIETETAPLPRDWLQHLMVATATGVGVVISAALGLALFLR